MPSFLYPIFRWGLLLQAIAVVHFIRRRPDTWWLWIILLGGGLGAMVYIAVEVVPDLGLLGESLQFFPRRQRIGQLEAEVRVNPSAGNYEELGDLYLQNEKWAAARTCFDRAIAARADSLDPFYRRALAELGMGDVAAATPDLEKVVSGDFSYDIHRAAGLLAHAYAVTGKPEKAGPLFARVTQISTLSETQCHYAEFLAAQGRREEAREWAERIQTKYANMPRFQRRRDWVWFRRASALLGNLRRA